MHLDSKVHNLYTISGGCDIPYSKGFVFLKKKYCSQIKIHLSISNLAYYFSDHMFYYMVSLVTQMVKSLPAMQETWL